MLLSRDPFVPTPDGADYNDESVKRTGRNAKYFGGMAIYADKMVGLVMDKLDELKLRENTLVIFLGDNGTSPAVTSQFRANRIKAAKE
jgi:arylsulfatase A